MHIVYWAHSYREEDAEINRHFEVVESLFRHWTELEVKKDMEPWLELVADDALLQPAGDPAIVGKSAIRDWFVRFFEIPVSAMDPGALTVFVSESGDPACQECDHERPSSGSLRDRLSRR